MKKEHLTDGRIQLNSPYTAEQSHLKKALGIRGKLLLGFSVIILFLLIVVSTTLLSITHTENLAYRVINVDLPIYDTLVDLNTALFSTQIKLKDFVKTRDSISKTAYDNSWSELDQAVIFLSAHTADSNNQVFLQKWGALKTVLDQLRIEQNSAITAAASGNSAKAEQILGNSVSSLINKASMLLNIINTSSDYTLQKEGLLDLQSHHLNAGAQAILSHLFFIRSIEYSFLCLSIIFSLGIAFLTAYKILTPLNRAIDIARQISQGKRNLNIAVTSNDETGELLLALALMLDAIKMGEDKLQKSEAHTRELFDKIMEAAKLFSAHSSKVAAGDLRERLELSGNQEELEVMKSLGTDLNKMTDNLSSISKEITLSSQSMVSMLEEVRHAVDAQSSGSSQQASSINEITASLSEIEKSSMQTMEKAKMLGEVAEQTREKGQLGLEAVEQSVLGMKAVRDKVQIIAQTILDLSQQTQQVGEITAMVNNLAQQSKMLALNASIEAAKAGEAGKGFAIVAVEVKNLAEQSEQATTQVQKILEDIRHAAEKAVMVTEEGTKGVDHGTELVEQTGEIIKNLNDVIYEATIASQQIESAVRQEGAGIEQITTGMNEINEVTSSFVESSKQTKEAMGSLAEITKNLKKYVDVYKV